MWALSTESAHTAAWGGVEWCQLCQGHHHGAASPGRGCVSRRRAAPSVGSAAQEEACSSMVITQGY